MTKHVMFRGEKCSVQMDGCYINGQPAIQLVCDDGCLMATASVFVEGVVLREGETLIKDWSENKGMLKCLTDAGVVRDTGRSVRSGFVEANVVEIVFGD